MNAARPNLLAIPENFRGFSYTDMVEAMGSRLPDIPNLLIVGRTRPHSWEDFLHTPWEERYARTDLDAYRPHPDAPRNSS